MPINSTPKPLVGREVLLTAPTVEPVQFTDFDAAMPNTGDLQTAIELWLVSARQTLEREYAFSAVEQTWQVWYDVEACSPDAMNDGWYEDYPHSWSSKYALYLPSTIELPRKPLISVSSIKYYTEDSDTGVTFDGSNYRASTTGIYGRVALRLGKTWPTGLRNIDSLVIEYKAGFARTSADTGPDPSASTTRSNVPADIRDAIIQMTAHKYRNRSGSRAPNEGGAVASTTKEMFIPAGVRTALNHYRPHKI